MSSKTLGKDGDPSLSSKASELEANAKKVSDIIAKYRAQIEAAKLKVQANLQSDAKPNQQTASAVDTEERR